MLLVGIFTREIKHFIATIMPKAKVVIALENYTATFYVAKIM